MSKRLGNTTLCAILLMAVSLLVSSCSNINSADRLFSAIEKKYKCNGFNDVRYMISTIKINDDGSEIRSTCSGEYVRPSQHMLKTNLLNDDGYISKNDSIFAFVNGELVSSEARVNDFIVVVLDIYGMPADSAINRLESIGIANTSKFCEYTDEQTKKKSYIVGIDEYSDATASENQLWYDAVTLLPTVIQRNGADNHLYTITLENYVQVSGSGWIPQKITYHKDNQTKIIERIYDAVIPIYEKQNLSVETFCDSETFNDRHFSPNSNFSLSVIVEP